MGETPYLAENHLKRKKSGNFRLVVNRERMDLSIVVGHLSIVFGYLTISSSIVSVWTCLLSGIRRFSSRLFCSLIILAVGPQWLSRVQCS